MFIPRVRAFGCVLVLRSVLFGDLIVRIRVFGCFRLFGYEASGISGVGFQGFGCLVVFGCFVSSSSGIWLAGFGYLAVRDRVFGCPPLFGSKVVLGIWLLSGISFRRLRVFGRQDSGIWSSSAIWFEGFGYFGCWIVLPFPSFINAGCQIWQKTFFSQTLGFWDFCLCADTYTEYDSAFC